MKSLAISFLIAFVLLAMAGATAFPHNRPLTLLASLSLVGLALTSISTLVAYSLFGATKCYRAFSIGALLPLLLFAFGNEATMRFLGFQANMNMPSEGMPVALIMLMVLVVVSTISGTTSMIAWLCFFEEVSESEVAKPTNDTPISDKVA